ncbi:MAG: VWA domain-containing protein [Planctomycetota bacterium]
MARSNQRRRPDRRGAILVLVAVILPVFALLAAFAIDVAWMQLVRTELRTATDAASRAGAKTLSMEQDQALARAAAIDAASRNNVGGRALGLAPADVQFGNSAQPNPSARFAFRDASTPINAVHVDGRRTAGSPDGPVPLFFGRLLGVNTFEPTQSATSTMLDRDICLVIDRSGSMGLDLFTLGDRNGQNCGPLSNRTRFVALANAVDAFIAELELTFPREQLALASYSSNVTRNCGRGRRFSYPMADIRQQLTFNYAGTSQAMADFVRVGIGGSTAIGEGLRRGIQALEGPNARPFAVKTIVLMTDGIHNTGVEPVVIAQQARDRDFTVHTVTFSAGADQSRMRATADITGGKHFHADTAGDLTEVFREIARTLPVLITE